MKNFIPAVTLIISTFVSIGAQAQGLIGTEWEGESVTEEYRVTYLFSFHAGRLALSSTCHVDGTSSTLNSTLDVSYSADGNSVLLKSGFQSDIPTGSISCSIGFPAGVKFHLENEQIYLEFDGNRRPTHMKRVK